MCADPMVADYPTTCVVACSDMEARCTQELIDSGVECELDGCVVLEIQTTDEEPTCDCVAEDDFDALVDHVSMQAEEIAALQEELAALDAASLEATVNDVDSELSMLSSCVASVMDGTYVAPEPMSSSPSMSPTMSLYVEYSDANGMVCGSGMPVPRTFKYDITGGADECAEYCAADEGCMYFSVTDDKCIGCTEVPTTANQHTGDYLTYMMNMRRRLTEQGEIEALRAENEQLRALLAEHSN